MSTSLSDFHTLLYAGADLSSFSKVLTFQKSDSLSGRYHSRSACYSRPRYEVLYSVKADPTKIPASKACPDCFDAVVKAAHPIFSSLADSVLRVQPKTARFMRTALNDKSKKNTPEKRAQMAAELKRSKENFAKPSHDEAVYIFDLMMNKIDQRIVELRQSIKSGPLHTNMLRLTAAAAGFYLPARVGSPFAKVKQMIDFRNLSWESPDRQMFEDLANDWCQAVVEETDLDSVRDRYRGKIVSQFQLDRTRQCRFEPVTAFTPGQDLEEWLRANWREALRREFESVFDQLEESFKKALDDPEKVLAHVRISQYRIFDTTFVAARAFPAMLELYSIRSEGTEHIVWMPKKIFSSFAGGLDGDYGTHEISVRAALDASHLTPVMAETAASLCNFGSLSNPSENLKMNMDAAFALES